MDTIAERLLLASDGSEHSLRAARVVGRLFGARKDVEVIMLYVAHVPRELDMTDSEGNKLVPEIPLDVVIRRSAEPVLRHTRDALGMPAEQVKAEVQVGVPAEEIVSFARYEQCSLIVVGSRGLSPLSEMVLGSVSHRVLHTAPCPVLVVR